MSVQDLLSDGLQQLKSGRLNVVIKHLSVLMQDQTVGSPVQLLVGQLRGLVIVDLVDGFLYGLPVLERLVLGHDSIAHFVSVNQELLLRKS